MRQAETHVFPAHGLAALATCDIADTVQARSHRPVFCLAFYNVEHRVKEVCLPMLTVETLLEPSGDNSQSTSRIGEMITKARPAKSGNSK